VIRVRFFPREAGAVPYARWAPGRPTVPTRHAEMAAGLVDPDEAFKIDAPSLLTPDGSFRLVALLVSEGFSPERQNLTWERGFAHAGLGLRARYGPSRALYVMAGAQFVAGCCPLKRSLPSQVSIGVDGVTDASGRGDPIQRDRRCS